MREDLQLANCLCYIYLVSGWQTHANERDFQPCRTAGQPEEGPGVTAGAVESAVAPKAGACADGALPLGLTAL